MSDSLSFRLDLIPLAIGIAVVSIATSMAVILIRRANRDSSADTDLQITTWLTLVVALGLVGVLFLFQGLFI